jgi:hypothetical protein
MRELPLSELYGKTETRAEDRFKVASYKPEPKRSLSHKTGITGDVLVECEPVVDDDGDLIGIRPINSEVDDAELSATKKLIRT